MKRKLLLIALSIYMFSGITFSQVIDESFETWPPTGWTLNPSSGTGSWQQDDGTNHGPGSACYGSNAAMFNNSSYYVTSGDLITPAFDVSSETNPTLSFYWWNNDNIIYAASIDVYTSMDGSTWTLLETIQTYGSGTSTWVHYTHGIANNVVKVKLIATSGYGIKNTFVDKFVIEDVSCPAPSNQTETNITTSSADLGWTENGSATTWEIMIDTAGFDTTGYVHTSVTTNPYNSTGLTANTSYDWYVRSSCGGGSYSYWTDPNTFTTAPPALSIPFTWDFENNSYGTYIQVESGNQADIFTNSASANVSSYGSQMEGKTFYGWSGSATSTTEAQAWNDNASHISKMNMTVDATGKTAVLLQFDLKQTYSYGSKFSWFRVMVNGNKVGSSINPFSRNGDAFVRLSYYLSSYAGTTFNLSLQHSGKYNNASGNGGDNAYVDNISITAPICPDPSLQTEDSLKLNSAQLSWTENGSATEWNIRIGISGLDTTGTSYSVVTNDTITVDTLLASTTYDWYVRASCGGGDYSGWIGPNNFTTTNGKATGPYPINGIDPVHVSSDTLAWNPVDNATKYLLNIGTTSGGSDVLSNFSIADTIYVADTPWDYDTQYFWTVSTVYNETNDTVIGTEWDFATECSSLYTLEYTQDFADWPPACWTINKLVTGSTNEWEQYNNDGVECAKANLLGQQIGNTYIMNTPVFDVSGLTTPSFYFKWSHKYSSTSPNDSLSVEVTDDNGATWHQVWAKGGAILNSNDGAGISTPGTFATTADFNLSEYGTNIKIRFFATSGYGPDLFIDHVVVRELPSCPSPYDQTETNITTSGANLGWTDTSGSHWDIYVVPSGEPAPTQTTIPTADDVTANPYTWSGGTSGTKYDWYVRNDCNQNNTGTSTWTGPYTFTTRCKSTHVPYFQNFDAVTEPDFPLCMIVENTNSDIRTWETLKVGLNASNAAIIKWSSSLAMDDWFFTKGLKLLANVTYKVSFAYKEIEFSNWHEKLAVDWGTAANSTAMSGNPIFDKTFTNGDWHEGSGTFTPATSGIYYVGFHGHSDPDQLILCVDDIKIEKVEDATTWTGASGNDWNTTANWSQGLPSSTSLVTIPAGLTNYPTLNSATTIGSLIIESGASGDASIIGDNFLTVTTNATVQRYTTAGVWHDFSSPVQGQTLNNLYLDGSPDVWTYHFNEPDNSRTYMTAFTDPLDVGAGYELWVDGSTAVTYNFSGALNRNDVTLTTASTPALSFTGANPLGYNLIGNPFASPIALDSGAWNMDHVDSTFWVWDGTTYKDYNTASPGASNSLTGGIIPMGQGFFIHANAANPTITIPIAARVHSSQAYYKSTHSNVQDMMKLRAMIDNDKFDELNILFINGANELFENRDTRKMFAFSGNAPQVYAIISDEELSKNSLPALNPGDERTVDVGYKAGVNGTQTLVADLSSLPETDVVLEDLKLNKVQNLNNNPVYSFEATTSQDPDRFKLHFNRVMGIDNHNTHSAIRAYACEKNIYVLSNKEIATQKKVLTVYDITGRTLVNKTLPPGDIVSVPVNASNAYVVVKVISNGEVYTTKVFIK